MMKHEQEVFAAIVSGLTCASQIADVLRMTRNHASVILQSLKRRGYIEAVGVRKLVNGRPTAIWQVVKDGGVPVYGRISAYDRIRAAQ